MPSENSPVSRFRAQTLAPATDESGNWFTDTVGNVAGWVGDAYNFTMGRGSDLSMVGGAAQNDFVRSMNVRNMVPTGNGKIAPVGPKSSDRADVAQAAANLGTDARRIGEMGGGLVAAPIVALDYGTRGLNTGIATTALTSEAVVALGTGAKPAVPSMRDGIDAGDIWNLGGAAWGSEIQALDQNGQEATALNAITAGQGIATFWGRGTWNVASALVPGSREWMDEKIMEDTDRALADPNNNRLLYSWLTGLSSDFDVTNYDQRESAFNQGLGRWISGASDAAIQWYVGVDVLAMKGAGLAGRTLFTRSIDSLGDVNKLTDDVMAHDAWAKGLDEAVIKDEAGNVVRTVAAKKTDVGRLATSLVKMNEKQVLRHKIATQSTDRMLVARILGRANDYEAVSLGLRAMAGDMAAVDQLIKFDSIAGDTLKLRRENIDRLQSILDFQPTNMVGEAFKTQALRSLDNQDLGHLTDVYKQALEENKPLRDMVASLSKDGGIPTVNIGKISLSKLSYGPNSVNSMARQAAKAADRADGNYLWTKFRTGKKFGRTIYVGKSIQSGVDYWKTARQVGRVDLNNSDLVVGEFDAVFGTTPMFRALAKMPEETLLPGTDETVTAFRSRMYQQIIDAPTASARWEVMQEFDATVTRALAARYEIAPERVAQIVDRYSTARQGLLEQVQRHGFIEDNGDIYVLEELRQALKGFDMQSKKAESYFTTDFNFLETIFRLERGSGARRATTRLGYGLDEGWSRFDAIWRPLVLMRLGYTQRNVAEGWLRELAAYGTIGSLVDRGMGSRINAADRSLTKWAAGFGRAGDAVTALPRRIKHGSVRKAMHNLEARRYEAEQTAKAVHKSQQELAEARMRLSAINAEHRKAAQAAVARQNMDRLEEMVGYTWTEIDDTARGRMTALMDNAQEVMIPSSAVRPLLRPMGKGKQRAKTLSGFDNSEDAISNQIADSTVPTTGIDDFVGVDASVPVDEGADVLTQYLSKSEAEEWQSLKANFVDGDQYDSAMADRWNELQELAYFRAMDQAMDDGHKVVRIVDSGLYQILHSTDEFDPSDLWDNNIAVLLKEDFDKATAVRANVAGDALDLRFEVPDVTSAAAVGRMAEKGLLDRTDDIVHTSHMDVFGEEVTAYADDILDDLTVLSYIAQRDPQIAHAIGMWRMVRKLPEDAQAWFKDNGLLIPNKRLKSMVKEVNRRKQILADARDDVAVKRQEILDMVDDFDWDEFGAGDIPVFHGGTRVKGDTLNPDPINNVEDPGAVHKGIGFYNTENPGLGVEYIINRAIEKDGEPVFYATTVDPYTSNFYHLDDVIDSYEAEDEIKRVLSRMQEKYGDEADLEDAWFEVDGAVQDRIRNAENPLDGEPEILQETVDLYRQEMVSYFQRRIADDLGVDGSAGTSIEGRIIEQGDRTKEWADTEYQAQMLWVNALREEGFDGVSHLGGQAQGTIDHNVYVFYNQPELTRIDEISDEAIRLREMSVDLQKQEGALTAAERRYTMRSKVAPYEAGAYDASTMTADQERLLGKYMEANGVGRIYVNDAKSPSGYRVVVNPDMMSVNTDQLDAVLPGAFLTKDFSDRSFAALMEQETVRHPQVWMPKGVDKDMLLAEMGGDQKAVDFLLTGKGTPETKAKVARYMETRQGVDGSNPYTHVQIGNKFYSVSDMLGKKKTGAAYRANLEGDEVDAMQQMLVANDPRLAELEQQIGNLQQEVAGGLEQFTAQQDEAKALAETLRKRLGRKASGKQTKGKMGSGEETFRGSNFEEFETAGVFSAENQGMKNAMEAGSDRRVQMDLYGLTDRSMRQMQRTMKPTVYNPGDKFYWHTFSDEINKIWRNDPVGEMLFKGMDVEDIFTALKSTDRGRAWIRDVAGISDFRGYVSKDILNEDAERAILTEIADRQQILKRLIPGSTDEQAELFQHIATHDVSPAWLQSRLGWRTDLADLEGFGVQYNMGKVWRSFTSRTMEVLGTVPENALVRHPFYRARWREEMQRQIDIYAPQISARQGGGPAKFTEAQINAMNRAAKDRALRQVNDTLYTIQRVSTPAYMFRFIAPFFPAWASSMKFWLMRMPVEKPETIARYGLAFGAPESAGMLRDENGNTVRDSNVEGNFVPAMFERVANKFVGGDEGQITIQMTPSVAKAMAPLTGGNASLSISKGSLDMLLQGEHFWIPGMGPLVAMPASWLAAQMPDIASELESGNVGGLGKFGPVGEMSKALYQSVIPFGPTKEKDFIDAVTEAALPAAVSRKVASLRGMDSASFSNAAMSIYRDQIIDWELSDRQGKAPDFLDAVHKAQDFFDFRVAVALTAPFAPGFQSKYKFYIDEWRRIEQKHYGPDGEGYRAAQEEFIGKYGTEFFAATQSLSAGSSGVGADVGEFKEFKSNPELMAKMANIGPDASYMTMATRPYAASLNEDGFDPAVYAWQFNREIEGAPGKYFRSGAANRSDMMLDVDKEIGWFKYNQNADKFGAMLESGSITEGEYDALMSAASKKIGAQYEGWWTEFNDTGGGRYINSVHALDTLLEDGQWMSKHGSEPYGQALQSFNGNRNMIIKMLRARKLEGGSDNIEAKQNQDLAALYEHIVGRAAKVDPSGEFTRMHDRFFGSDRLKPIPGRDY